MSNRRTGKLTDAELDDALAAAHTELLNHARATSDPTVFLATFMDSPSHTRTDQTPTTVPDINSRFVDVVARWSKRIAERVAPEEVRLAADVGVAYAKGGKARKGLLARPGVQPGAFGPGSYAVDLHLILRALADARDVVLPLLSGPALSNLLAAASLLVALRAGHGCGQHAEPDRPPAQAPEPARSDKDAVDLAFASLRGRLITAGLTEKRADEVTFKLLEELLKDPAEAAQFVDALSAVPDGDARPKSSAKTKGRRARRRSRR
jgi:hypothetical protein